MNRTAFVFSSIFGAVVMMLAACGCSTPRITETGRSAVEQFLLSGVVDLCMEHTNFNDFSGKKAFLEYEYLAPQVDKSYVQGALELQLAKSGITVTKDAKEADILIQSICGVLATDTNKFNIGTPELPIPLPDTSLNVAIPEISLFQKLTRSGYGRFSYNILEAKSRKPLKTIDGVTAKTSYTNWIIVMLPFKSHDMNMDVKEGKETEIKINWP